jgi:hypothetical protein
MSAHSAGAANYSHLRLERQRESLLRQAMSRKQEKECYLQTLAERLSAECDLPLPIARKHVEKLSIAANTKRETEAVRSPLTFAKFG